MRSYFLCLWILALSFNGVAQVDEIKKASSNSSRSGSSEKSSDASFSYLAIDLLQISLQGLAEWQRIKLQTREENPSIVSLDIFLQGAAQPSSYYILHPRIRGNWGIFSTDFRMNYLIEEGVDGVKHIRTSDWQIIQLNFVTTRNINFYAGWGFIHEDFNNGNYYNEWSASFRVKPEKLRTAFQVEYRHSEPRIEFSGNVQFPIVQSRPVNLFLTGGAVFQQYYSSIKVWGMQSGLMLKLY
jgi:hypothetical protein